MRALEEEIRELSRPDAAQSLYFIARAWLLIAAAIAANVCFPHPALAILSVAFIGARQHSLLELMHDASHGNLFAGRRANEAAGYFLVLTMLHHPYFASFVQWRRVHELHHRFLGGPEDLTFELRKDWTPDPGPWQLLSAGLKDWLFALARSLRTTYYVPPGSNGIWGKYRLPHLLSLFVPYRGDPEMERERRLKLAFIAAVLTGVQVLGLWRPFLLFWVLPLCTWLVFCFGVGDRLDHRWPERGRGVRKNTLSFAPSFLEKVFLAELHRGFHLEHHLHPRVPCFRLPRLHALLKEAGEVGEPARGMFRWRETISSLEWGIS